MPVKPLLELAQQAAMRSAKEIDDFGEIPYKLVKPVIAKIENPHQLVSDSSPRLEGLYTNLGSIRSNRILLNFEGKIMTSGSNSLNEMYRTGTKRIAIQRMAKLGIEYTVSSGVKRRKKQKRVRRCSRHS